MLQIARKLREVHFKRLDHYFPHWHKITKTHPPRERLELTVIHNVAIICPEKMFTFFIKKMEEIMIAPTSSYTLIIGKFTQCSICVFVVAFLWGSKLWNLVAWKSLIYTSYTMFNMRVCLLWPFYEVQKFEMWNLAAWKSLTLSQLLTCWQHFRRILIKLV